MSSVNRLVVILSSHRHHGHLPALVSRADVINASGRDFAVAWEAAGGPRRILVGWRVDDHVPTDVASVEVVGPGFVDVDVREHPRHYELADPEEATIRLVLHLQRLLAEMAAGMGLPAPGPLALTRRERVYLETHAVTAPDHIAMHLPNAPEQLSSSDFQVMLREAARALERPDADALQVWLQAQGRARVLGFSRLLQERGSLLLESVKVTRDRRVDSDELIAVAHILRESEQDRDAHFIGSLLTSLDDLDEQDLQGAERLVTALNSTRDFSNP